MKKSGLNYLVIFTGVVLIVSGLYLNKTLNNPQEFLLALPYVCIGIGCGLFGHGIGNVVSHRTLKNYPDIEREMKIAKNDERNIAIMNHAKAKAYDLMTYVFGALLLTISLMGTDMVVVLLLVFAYLFVEVYAIYYHYKMDKEM